MQERINDVIRTVCGTVGEAYGETPDPKTLFASKSGNVRRSVAAARQFAHYAMHRLLGFSVTYIARATGTTRACVFSNVRKCEKLTDLYADYQEIKDKILNKTIKDNERTD